MPKAKSKAQARLFGYIASGGNGRFKKFPVKEARKRLRGVKFSKLPEKKKVLGRMLQKRR